MNQLATRPQWRGVFLLILIAGLILMADAPSRAEPAQPSVAVLVAPENSFHVWTMQNGHGALSMAIGGWGPAWAWKPGPTSDAKATNGELKSTGAFVVDQAAGQVINIVCTAKKADDHTVTFRYDLSADKDVPVTMLMVAISPTPDFNAGVINLTSGDGTTKAIDLPLHLQGNVEAVSKAEFAFKPGAPVTITIDPPSRIQPENNQLRVMLAHEVYPKGQSTVTVSIKTPDNISFQATAEDQQKYLVSPVTAEWFAFAPRDDNGPSVIGMQDWLEKPAGKHGGVRSVADHFELEDGSRIKFWGVDLSYAAGCAPEKKNAEMTAARYAKYGINGVRLHKFLGPSTWEGINDHDDVTKFDAAGLDRLDYFCSQLQGQGIYYGFSHTFGFIVGPGNKDKLLAYDEIAKQDGKTYALINFAEDVQDLLIQRLVTLLKHENPYTHKTYAEDAALSYIECQNEDDIFFFTTDGAFNNYPTYRKHFAEQFSDWLKTKYTTRDALAKAWGAALKPEETFESKNIELTGNPWFMSEDGLKQHDDAGKRRLLDNAEFLHVAQNKFYAKFVKAVRDAGYKGPLVGSPWQAPAMVPHYYNLRSDYLVGYVDRHNYFGGGISDTMLKQPGSGYLGTGLQQVIDRPFGISEWIHVYPSLYSAEGPAIMAAYAMGLQGWDASYEFQSSSAHGFDTTVGQQPYGVWESDVPTQIGQYPTLSRMLMRNDVKEADVISTRKVSLKDLENGTFNFSDKITQTGDVKNFSGSVPPESLAAGRVTVQFVDDSQPSTMPDLTKYLVKSVITSSTNQLVWDFADKGYFTINTDGTKGVVGFAEGKDLTLGDVKIAMQCPYASVIVTAVDKAATLANAKSVLVSAVARNCNSGFKFFSVDETILDNGKAPIMLEPVKAQITFTGKNISAVNVLDHDGCRTKATVPANNGSFTIDGARDKALYYEVVFQ